jgi:hypothetical protein
MAFDKRWIVPVGIVGALLAAILFSDKDVKRADGVEIVRNIEQYRRVEKEAIEFSRDAIMRFH